MDTYAELVTTCQQLAEDTSTEFVAYIPTATMLAENRLFRLLDVDFSKEGTLATTNADRDVAKPADHRVTHDIYMTVGTERVRLICKTEDYIKDYWPSTTLTDVPKYYAEKDEATWIVAPTPNSVYTLTVEYEGQPPYLTDAVQTNLFMEKFPDLLLYAVMSNMSEWMKDNVAKGEWEGKLQEALASANNEGTRQRHDDNTNANNPIGGRNTKVKNGV